MKPGRADQRFIARADAATCDACPLLAICPLRPQGSQRTPGLYFHLRTFQVAQKRQQVTTSGPAGKALLALESKVGTLGEIAVVQETHKENYVQ